MLRGEETRYPKKLFPVVERVVTALGKDVGVKFWELTDEYTQSRREIDPKILKFIEEKGLHQPPMQIYEPNSAQELLESFGFEGQNPVGGDNLMVLFRMPKPMEVFWKKRFAKGDLTEPPVIEWGWFYRQTRSFVNKRMR